MGLGLISFLKVNISSEKIGRLEADEIRRIEIVNYISFVSICNMLVYIPFYIFLSYSLFKPAIHFLSLMSLLSVGLIFFNKRGFHQISKVILVILVPFSMSYVSGVLYDKGPGFQVYLLVAAIIPLFLWSVKQKLLLFGAIGLSLCLYILLEFFPPFFEPRILLPDRISNVFRSTNTIVCFIAAGGAIAFYQILYNKKEKQLVKQAKELELSQAHKDKVYSVIAHDLRGPVSAFVGLTDAYMEDYDDYSDMKRKMALAMINETSISLQNLLENLLVWSKMQAGTIKSNVKKLKLKKVILDAIAVNNIIIQKKQHKISLDINDNCLVMADRYMLSTVLRNLLSNALKYTPKKGEISISAKLVKDMVEVCVADNGKGITKKDLMRLFNFQNDSEFIKGNGLGLLVCREFVELNTGQIWAESKLGAGSKFYFTLESVP